MYVSIYFKILVAMCYSSFFNITSCSNAKFVDHMFVFSSFSLSITLRNFPIPFALAGWICFVTFDGQSLRERFCYGLNHDFFIGFTDKKALMVCFVVFYLTLFLEVFGYCFCYYGSRSFLTWLQLAANKISVTMG